jgi:hypothetical protein
MDSLGTIRIEVYINQTLQVAAPLSAEQQMLLRQLVWQTMNRGNWTKSALRSALREEMVNTSRHIGGDTMNQIEQLMAGIDISVELVKEEKVE